MSSFKPQDWILVGDVDACAHTREQIDVLKSMQYPLRGAILCNDVDQQHADACKQVPAFPTFCNTRTNLCVAGLRRSPQQFEQLQALSDHEERTAK